ncbi:MAG TPA: hypothetical protein VL147_09725 [Devosia sp.]|nr:hypothetical protein [Devosia sp.]
MADPKLLESAEQFYFETPLYARLRSPFDPGETPAVVRTIYGHEGKLDGFCPYCQRQVTFTCRRHVGTDTIRDMDRIDFDEGTLICDRNRVHTLHFHWLFSKGIFEKVGQFPSSATITNAELSQYRQLMGKVDSEEFYKAVGLAAHGVGIGSFVYLRRVFERLIWGRFEEFRSAEGWDDASFRKMRMSDKIQHLKDHLPPFLVSNSAVYSILSVGVHRLDEKQCLGFFELMKDTIIVILEEDKLKKEEFARRERLTRAISGIDLSKVGETDESNDGVGTDQS